MCSGPELASSGPEHASYGFSHASSGFEHAGAGSAEGDPAVQQRGRGARVDGLRGPGQPGPEVVLQGLREARERRQRGRRVDQDRVADRARLAADQLADHLRVRRRVAAAQVVRRRPRDAHGRRVEAALGDLAVRDHPDRRRRGRGDLVEAVVAPDHQGAGAAAGERLRQHPRLVGVRAADQRRARLGRVGQRAEQVERRRDAELAAHRAGVPQRRVERRRQEEPDADLGEAALDVLRRQADPHAEGLQHVRRAGLRRRAAVAVLGHRRARRRRDDRRHRRDVDRVGAVAAGADDVDGRPVQLDPPGVRQHRGRHPGDLLGRLALGPQRHREPGDPGRAGGAAHDLVHRPRRVLRGQIGARDQLFEQGWPGAGDRGGHRAQPFTTGTRRARSTSATVSAAVSGSSGCTSTASACDQVASQRSSRRRTATTIGGQSVISLFSCRHRPMPPVGCASPSRMARSTVPASTSDSTSAMPAAST
ncbi:putative RNA-binding protein [Amycolatopsis vancoresmycina DSM 44592]|uniref:Putative RNA-binding protein n=1 Tax=Amycolatopsis vancoresmycina DSM 44592 TaxID=1292037 RepID=R1FLR7_9PSEU|nr:putative RNA-binding protein [Amycolatopsis vancoresmycina DSM 44592]